MRTNPFLHAPGSRGALFLMVDGPVRMVSGSILPSGVGLTAVTPTDFACARADKRFSSPRTNFPWNQPNGSASPWPSLCCGASCYDELLNRVRRRGQARCS